MKLSKEWMDQVKKGNYEVSISGPKMLFLYTILAYMCLFFAMIVIAIGMIAIFFGGIGVLIYSIMKGIKDLWKKYIWFRI